MNQLEEDKLTRNKINSLDTLSGGIVFGKEEAWEKLQERMERKPVRRIPLRYWMAAAAVLLVVVCGTIYYYPGKEVAANNSKEQVKQEVKNIAAAPAEAAPAIQQQETSSEKMRIVIADKGRKHIANTNKQGNTVAPEQTTAIQAPVNEPPVSKEAIATVSIIPLARPPVRKTMKVVNINDLDKNDMRDIAPALVLNNFPSLDVSKLRVVHINDVVREEYEIQKIRKEDRLTIGPVSFTKPWYYHEDPSFIHSLQIKINLQN